MTVRTALLGALAWAGMLAAPGVACGQAAQSKPAQAAKPSTEVEFLVFTPGDGPYYARLLPSPDAGPKTFDPQGPFSDRKLSVKFDPAQLGKSPRIAIDDVGSGNTAIVPIVGQKRDVNLKRLDFDHVRRVEVAVTYDGKPLQAARVTLAASDGAASTVIVDPSAQGVAVFHDVPVGKAKLTIQYGDHLTEVSDIQITGEHPPGELRIPAPVKNRAPTLSAPAAPQAAPPQAAAPAGPSTAPTGAPAAGAPVAPAPPSPAQGLAHLIGGLLGIALVVGIGYVAYRWYLSGGLAATLKKAGIETAGPMASATDGAPAPWQPNAPPPPVVTDPALCPFCGQRRDAAGNCACTVTPGAPGGTAAPVSAPSQPRLVGSVGAYAGDIFPIAASGATVGRDPASDVALCTDTTVSRRHASIQPGDAGWIVTDLGSSNGVFVNGVRIGGSQPLRPGDEVQIGNTRFRFEC